MSTSSLIHPVLNCVQILCVAQAENKPARCGGSEDKTIIVPASFHNSAFILSLLSRFPNPWRPQF